MKKLVLLACSTLCIVCMAAALKTTGVSKKIVFGTVAGDSIIVEESLNGISQTDAGAMVQNTAGTIDNNPANTQIWFNLQTLISIDSLLMSDSSGAVKPDGIRIYFSSNTPTSSNPLHYNNGIVVVSTYKAGYVVKGHKTIVVHSDYFEHPQNAGLFSLGTIGGVISHDNDTTNGAMLYHTCNCDVNSCITSPDHYIKRSTGEKMVQAFSGNPFNAKSEWFDIDMFNALVAEMKRDNDNGIRIYFARDTADAATPGLVGKAKFVIATTKEVTDPETGKKINKDNFDCNQAAMVATTRAVQRKLHGIKDNGELCPDNCDGLKLP